VASGGEDEDRFDWDEGETSSAATGNPPGKGCIFLWHPIGSKIDSNVKSLPLQVGRDQQ
jgi:hypothetical protein